MMLRPTLTALLLTALPAAASAQATQCLTSNEATALVTTLMPDGLSVAVERCRAHLPADAYLLRSGDDLIARYRAEADRAYPEAKPALVKMMGKDGAALLKNLDDATARKVFAAGLTTAMEKDLKPSTCPDIDRVAAALDPLPARNMGLLIGAILDMTSRGKTASKGPFAICQPASSVGRP